jgi:L-ribulose-5-phosphate 4-epimerase
MLLKGLRELIVEVGNRLVVNGLAHDGQGNISAFDRTEGLIAITPSAIPYNQRQANDICVIDIEGKIIQSGWKPTSETALHLVFYQNRGDVEAVVHTHAPYSTVFGIINETHLPVVLNEAAMVLGREVPIAPYARPGTRELALITLNSIQDSLAVIMAHHGLVTVGVSLEAAYNATIAVEDTARVTILARSMGVQVVTLPMQEVAALHDIYVHKYRPEKLE